MKKVVGKVSAFAAAAALALLLGGSVGAAEGGKPERGKTREKIKAACAEDVGKFCAGSEGRALFKCIRDNEAKLSAGCKTAIEEMKKFRKERGGKGGGPNKGEKSEKPEGGETQGA